MLFFGLLVARWVLSVIATVFRTLNLHAWRLAETDRVRKDELMGENPNELIFVSAAAYRQLIEELRRVAEVTPAEEWQSALLKTLTSRGLDRESLAPHLIALALDPRHEPGDGPGELRERLRTSAGEHAPIAGVAHAQRKPVRTGRDRRDGTAAL